MRHLGKTILHGLLLGAAAGALTMSFASTSHAAAIAYSTLQISGFQFLQADGSPFGAGAFDPLTPTNNTAAEARLNGSGPTGDDITNGNSDVVLQCAGDCGGIAQNDFGMQGGSSQFSRADAQLFGDSLGAGLAANSVAEVQLNIPSNGSSSSNVGTVTDFSFSDVDGALRIRFDATPEMFASLDELGGAFAGLAWHIAITDGAGDQIFSWAPDGTIGGLVCDSPDADANDTCSEIADPFALNNSVGVGSAGQIAYDPGQGTFVAVMPIFDADQTYTVTILHKTSVQAVQSVPEPAAAGMLGVGLLGLIGLRRRRRRRSN